MNPIKPNEVKSYTNKHCDNFYWRKTGENTSGKNGLILRALSFRDTVVSTTSNVLIELNLSCPLCSRYLQIELSSSRVKGIVQEIKRELRQEEGEEGPLLNTKRER